MQEPTCKDCRHFRQHYVKLREGRFDPIPCGHCVFPRLKHRTTDTTACFHFQKKEAVPQAAERETV